LATEACTRPNHKTSWLDLATEAQILFSGWRGRIRTFDLLIQSLVLGISLTGHYLSVRRASVGRRIGVSQMPTPK
jgi:hypothetical protein